MLPVPDAFDHDVDGSDIRYGRGRIADLGTYLEERGFDSALVVCGSNVGANDELMGPVRAGLGDVLAGVFDGTTPEKRLETVYEGIDVMAELEPDVLVGVGGGSSLDVARQMSYFEADGRSFETVRSAAATGEFETPPMPDATPVVVVPTTFAGADLSSGGSIVALSAAESPTGQPIMVKGSNRPLAMIYDPSLFETTPMGALAGSAMNGFNKGIETIYARSSTPVSDATSIHGLRLLTEGFPRLGDGDPAAMDRAVIGMILVQLHRKISIVHAFGHGFSRRYPIQQGEVHAIVVPYVLEYLFEEIDAKRSLIAEGLGIDPEGEEPEALATAIVEAVTAVRDAFDLPTRLRDLDPVDPEDFPDIAAFILDDHLMPEAPAALEPTEEAIEETLHRAW